MSCSRISSAVESNIMSCSIDTAVEGCTCCAHTGSAVEACRAVIACISCCHIGSTIGLNISCCCSDSIVDACSCCTHIGSAVVACSTAEACSAVQACIPCCPYVSSTIGPSICCSCVGGAVARSTRHSYAAGKRLVASCT